jgi:hypothetical protein
MAAINTFGVTQASVAAFHFPMWPAFSAASKPTATTVTSMISEAGGQLASMLYGEAITASAITDVASSAYVMCAEQLRRMVALKVLKASTQQDPELAKALQAEIDAWFVALKAAGGTFLGDEGLTTSPSDPDGPTSHISEYSLKVDEASNMSTVVPRLRRDDQL